VRIINWQFRPGLWPSVAVLLLLPLLLRLGFWQLDRADQKEALQGQYVHSREAAALDLNQAHTSASAGLAHLQWRSGIVRGRFDTAHVFLLDNQVMARRAGYFVYGVFSLAKGGHKILVNYGWVPLGADRSKPPDIALPKGELRLEGLIKRPPATGIKLAATEEENLGKGFYRVQEINPTALAASKGWRLFPYVLRLPPPAPGGFVRDWTRPGFGKERHLGYAFQWFALAAALVLIYLVVNVKRVSSPDEE